MPIWEYKIITSGALGFASPQLLEQHLNQLGKEEWEIIEFQIRPDNPLAFHGLARRPVMRDWVVEGASPTDAPAARSGAIPTPPEERHEPSPSAEELRAGAEERRESLLARVESLPPLRGAAADDEPGETAAFDAVGADEDLPTFFEAIRPHMRHNQKGPGMAVGIDYLAKKFAQSPADLIEALKECGFAIPAGAKDKPQYLEYDGDLYWLNINPRGQLWINTREKPAPVFRPAAGRKVAAEELPEASRPAETPASGEHPIPEKTRRQKEREEQPTMAAAEPLPEGPALLDRLRPVMRRNRHGGGLSGSVSYLARALKTEPPTLVAAFEALGLVPPPKGTDQPVSVEIGAFVYWLDRDKNGQTWINARERDRQPESPQAELALIADTKPQTQNWEPSSGASPLAAVRLLLKETTRGGVAAEIGRIAKRLGRSTEELLAALVAVGLKVPEKTREKPVFVEQAGEIFWLNRNARGELWLNAKVSKFAGRAADEKAPAAPSTGEPTEEKKPRRPRRRKPGVA